MSTKYRTEFFDFNGMKIHCLISGKKSLQNWVVISFGIPRNGENQKVFAPGKLMQRISQTLKQKGIGAVFVGTPGMGMSDGNTFESSVKQRSEICAAYCMSFGERSKVWLMGSSMGAAVSVLALRDHRLGERLSGITLLIPAGYASGADEKNFGDEFRLAITGTKRMSDEYVQLLAKLSKDVHLSLVTAELDVVIPQTITYQYREVITDRENAEAYVLLGAGHFLSDGQVDLDDAAQLIVEPIVKAMG